tara:strand:+ start:830 stop:1036 length:207 start_codon:yes stop_codon:yes gene_type:complete
MKNFIINIKNLIPYLILILIYFVFINIEAQRNQNNQDIENNLKSNEKKLDINNNKKTIKIPVIPYSQK